MRNSLILVMLFLASPCLVKADGGSTYIYHFKIDLTNHTTIDAYLIYSDYNHPSDNFVNLYFQNENFVRGFLFQKAADRTEKIDKLYTSLFRILEYQSVDEWLRGHLVISKCDRFNIPEKDIARINFVNRQHIRGQEISDLTDPEIAFLIREPVEMLNLKLDDDVQAMGDAYREFTLLSYNKDKSIDLKKVKIEIETEYVQQSRFSDFNEKIIVWQKIFLKYKAQLIKKDILLLEIGMF